MVMTAKPRNKFYLKLSFPFFYFYFVILFMRVTGKQKVISSASIHSAASSQPSLRRRFTAVPSVLVSFAVFRLVIFYAARPQR
jgi:hypothetical protein